MFCVLMRYSVTDRARVRQTSEAAQAMSSRSARGLAARPAAASSALNAARRAREFAALGESDRPVDVLVIGGGVTGAGVALDAASRGLSVVLVETHDLAFGTSRWSSKLVHGGLRYLASGDVAVARESAIERHRLMTTIAPHLVSALPQLLPFVPAVSAKQRAITRIGLALGDGLRRHAGTPTAVLPAPRRVRRHEALRLVPALRREGLGGGLVSSDGQLVDDARLVTTIARTAAAYGARILTKVNASAVCGDGALLTDRLTGESLRLRARAVVNATGVWASQIDPGIRLRPSRGTHIVLDAERLGHPSAALTLPHPGSTSRFVFALPQQLGRVIVGLTDDDAPGPIPDVPAPNESEIIFLLETLSRALETPLSRSEVRGAFTGLRPLIDASGSTADISRKHHVSVGETGIVSVLGGKLTTYRAMAEHAVDLACRQAGLPDRGCVTDRLPLVGAPGSEARQPRAARISRPVEPVAPGLAVTRAAVAFAVHAEGALSADDVLDRRTRIGLVTADRERALDAVTALVEQILEDLQTV